ncbi:MAG: GAF domain-containing protein [Chloroflexi bacterium]|nr:GAF domain-containing protein [Chloroflexota bacterium]
MDNAGKTKEQLAAEMVEMHSRVAELEAEMQQKAAQYERHVTEMTIVNAISQAISSSTELDDVLEAVHHQVDRLLEAANFCVSVYDEESDEWARVFFVEGGQVLPRAHMRFEGGTGLTGCMIRDRKSLLFQSAEEIAAFQKAQGRESIGKSALSWLGVPLIIADKVVGGMAIQSYEQGNLYDEQDQTLFHTIASQVASAMNNLRLLREARQQAKELAVLDELGQALTARLSVKEMLDKVYRHTSRLVDTTNFCILLYDSKKHEFTFSLVISEMEDEGYPDAFSADEGVSGYILRTRSALLVKENVHECMKELGINLIGTHALSWLGVPLIAGDEVRGVMIVQSYSTPGLYDERDRDFLAAIANQTAIALQNAQMVENLEQMIEERTAELRTSLQESERLQQEIIEAQRSTLRELSTPLIPIMERIMVMPLIGSINSMRARDITRALLAGIRQHRAKVVILDITGVPLVDSGVASHLNKTIQAARLKGARTIVTGISDSVAETIVELGIDWSETETVSDLRTGLVVALKSMGIRLNK